MSAGAPTPRASWRTLPGGVWALGFGSLFMDTSSELIHSLLPLFMVTTLGASMVAVGVVEGIAEAAASIVKVFSGALSDFLRRRKALLVFGYALSAFTKPVFPLAGSVGWVFAARFADRIGKGIRGAPRDALVADLTRPEQRGAAYGLRQSLDSVGAVLGPLAAIGLMMFFAGDVRSAMWFAVIPAVITVALLAIWVREPERHEAGDANALPLDWREVRGLGSGYWFVVGIGAVFALARFSEAFLVLRAQDVGLEASQAPLVMVAMNIFYAAAAYPAGAAADRIGSRTLLGAGLAMLVAADLLLAFHATVTATIAGAALWGLHMAFTQGLLAKMVADAAPARLRGTAFGIFNLVSGIVLIPASVIAGVLWDGLGATATFAAGAMFAALTGALIAFAPRRGARRAA